jgi:hypothetical protein
MVAGPAAFMKLILNAPQPFSASSAGAMAVARPSAKAAETVLIMEYSVQRDRPQAK